MIHPIKKSFLAAYTAAEPLDLPLGRIFRLAYNREVMKLFTNLIAMMNKQALNQRRIQAKAVNEENEKYAFRIWFTRLGMIGEKYKITRQILMEILSGNSAFRTETEKERWTQRNAERRAAASASGEMTEA